MDIMDLLERNHERFEEIAELRNATMHSTGNLQYLLQYHEILERGEWSKEVIFELLSVVYLQGVIDAGTQRLHNIEFHL